MSEQERVLVRKVGGSLTMAPPTTFVVGANTTKMAGVLHDPKIARKPITMLA